MKLQNVLFAAVALSLFIFISCSSGDDSSNPPTNQELLTTDKWYNESTSSGSYTACEKNGYIEFKTNGIVTIDSFDDGSGTCESLGATDANYILTSSTTITITLESDMVIATIEAISQDQLTLIVEDETLVFDKTEG